ncbi:MAG TPA: fibronectin type III domain-containing protein [Candidatus Limnocylindrales bacterium]|nr:fibronectin type III domain-containing protein [Candidatus Limnocylindrales bacterium]
MAEFVNEQFGGTSGTELSAYNAAWSTIGGFAAAGRISNAGRLRHSSTGTFAYKNSGAPTSADYHVAADVHYVGAGSTEAGIAVRISGPDATASYYFVRYEATGQEFELYKVVSGTPTLLTNAAYSLSVGGSFRMALQAIGSTIKVYAAGAEVISITNADITAAGVAGVRFSGSAAGSDTVGLHLDNLVAADGAFLDATAPILTSATSNVTGQTTAALGATTDEANGTMYAVVTTSATQPSVAQIVAGQDHTGSAAVFAGNQAISSTGAKTFNATGLTAATAYYGHMVHRDAANNDSNRLSTSQFTTLPNAPTAPTIGATTGITSSGATINWTDNSSDETGFQIQVETPSGAGNWTNANTSPAAANATSLAIGGLSSSTEYRPRVRASNAGGDSAWSTGTAFNTAAGGGGSTLLPKLMQLMN